MSKVTVSIQYAGLQLQIGKNERGQDVTPLKPISDLFGLVWRDQRKKVTESLFLSTYLGISGEDILTSKADSRPKNPTYKEEIFIRLDRVAAYLMTINPDKVRAQGNISGAEYLEAKLNEWADALHDYEELGVAVNLNHLKTQEALRKQRASFAQMIGIKNKVSDASDRRALGHVVKQMAGELGIPYQLDLTEGA
jgi:hypothetical protein